MSKTQRAAGYFAALVIAERQFTDEGAKHIHAKILFDYALGLDPTPMHLAADVATVRRAMGH